MAGCVLKHKPSKFVLGSRVSFLFRRGGPPPPPQTETPTHPLPEARPPHSVLETAAILDWRVCSRKAMRTASCKRQENGNQRRVAFLYLQKPRMCSPVNILRAVINQSEDERHDGLLCAARRGVRLDAAPANSCAKARARPRAPLLTAFKHWLHLNRCLAKV